MSVYTTQVRNICETQCDHTERKGYDDVEEILEECWDKVIPNYPIFDENYRKTLNKKILLHYYTREIGTETVGLWKLRLKTKMGEIMPYYNQMYKSELLTFNPLYDVDIWTTHQGKGEETQNGSENATGNESSQWSGTDTKNRTVNKTVDSTSSDSTNDKGWVVEDENRNNTRQDKGWNVYEDNEKGNETGNNTTHTQFADTPQGKVLSEDLAENDYMTTDTVTKGSDTNDNTRNINHQDSHDINITDNGNRDVQGSHNNDVTKNGTKKDVENGTDNESVLYGKTDTRNSKNDVIKNNQINSLDEYTEHVSGKRGGVTYSAMLKEFRETFLNVDMMIIRELEPLFMQIWGDIS